MMSNKMMSNLFYLQEARFGGAISKAALGIAIFRLIGGKVTRGLNMATIPRKLAVLRWRIHGAVF